MKMVYESKDGVVASEAKRKQTKWVVLEKRMKKEAHFCMEQLDCNLVVVKNAEAQVLRLMEPAEKEIDTLPDSASSIKYLEDKFNTVKVLNVTPISSPEHSSFKTTVDRTSSISSFSEINWDLTVKQILPSSLGGHHDYEESDSESASENSSSLSTIMSSQQWMEDLSSADESSKQSNESIQ